MKFRYAARVQQELIENQALLEVSPGCLEILKAAFDQEMDGYLEMGVRHFCVGTDVSILMEWFRTRGARMREILDGV